MQAVQVTRFGPPDVLQVREVADPVPQDVEVVVEVGLVEVIFLDTQLRAGWGRDWFDVTPPWTPGTGVAGTVDGRRVVARTGDAGAYAERVAVPAVEAVDVPEGLDDAVALAALHDGVLALDRLERADLRPGSRVLVTAAAGSLGHWFVPLARAAGAHVTGAAGGARKVDAVAALGADLALDYREAGWVEAAGAPYDVVFDGAGGEVGRAALGLLRDGGTFFGHGAAGGDFGSGPDAGRGVRVVGVEQPIDDETWVRRIHEGLDLLSHGAVRPTIGQRVPLEDAAAAHAAMARREVVGKTVLVVRPWVGRDQRDDGR